MLQSVYGPGESRKRKETEIGFLKYTGKRIAESMKWTYEEITWLFKSKEFVIEVIIILR